MITILFSVYITGCWLIPISLSGTHTALFTHQGTIFLLNKYARLPKPTIISIPYTVAL